MRFRASINNVPIFLNLVQTIERLSKTCILKLSEDKMRIICDRAGEGGVQVWSDISVNTLFTDYRIQSNSNNEISMRIGPESLIRALKSGVNGEVTLKLAKKNEHAVLSFDIIILTQQSKMASVTQDVGIEVLKPMDVAKLQEPMCPEPDVHLVLPPLTKLRPVTERFHQLCNLMGVSANNAGHLKLSIETEEVRIETVWKDCKPFASAREDGEAPDPEAYATAYVPVKSFLKFLSSHLVSTSTIACICHNYCIIMYVYIGSDVTGSGDVLTYYIPGRLDGRDV